MATILKFPSKGTSSKDRDLIALLCRTLILSREFLDIAYMRDVYSDEEAQAVGDIGTVIDVLLKTTGVKI